MDGIARGHRQLLDGRLCRPDSKQWPLNSNLCTMTIVKLCWHNFTKSAYFMIFFVSCISYRPTDLSLLKEFSKNVSFRKFYIFHQISPNGGHWLATTVDYLCYSIENKVFKGDNNIIALNQQLLSFLMHLKWPWLLPFFAKML